MNVTAYCYWRIYAYDIAFFYEELPCFITELANLGFWYRSTGA